MDSIYCMHIFPVRESIKREKLMAAASISLSLSERELFFTRDVRAALNFGLILRPLLMKSINFFALGAGENSASVCAMPAQCARS
jgi:hypothetical protein